MAMYFAQCKAATLLCFGRFCEL